MTCDPRTPTRPARLQARERDRRALEMRMQGLTFSAIGVELGVTRQAAEQAVRRSLEETKAAIAERADELRAIEMERLEKITEVLWPRVLEGDLRAIDRVLRTRESFRRLTGLDLSQETGTAVGDTYVLTNGDVTLVPSGGRAIDARLPHERPESRAGEPVIRAEIEAGGVE